MGERQGTRRPRGHKTPAACVARVVEEACTQGRLGILDAVLPPRRQQLGATGPAYAHLPELLAAFRDGVPDARWTIVAQVSEGETVVTRLQVAGSFSGRCWGWRRRAGRPR